MSTDPFVVPACRYQTALTGQFRVDFFEAERL